jgi:YbgC/YbaW family acyl-CoA thioester hydrolase
MTYSFVRRRKESLHETGDPKPSAKIYTCTLEVRGYELDSFGHVNHGVYVSYLEHARWKMLEEEGITIKKFNDWGMWPVIIGIESHYFKPTFMGDVLEIRTQVVHHDRASFTFEQNIYRGDTHVVKAQVRSVMVDKQGRLVRRPDEINRLWENLQP